MKTGDFVVPNSEAALYVGNIRYSGAIVCCMEPFVLVSVDGGMVWQTNVEPENFTAVLSAHPDVFYRCMKQIPLELQNHHKAALPKTAAEVYGRMEERDTEALLNALAGMAKKPHEPPGGLR